MVVVSATPGAALEKEWAEHDIARYARVIAGQEMGQQEGAPGARRRAASTPPEKILMIGDAPGDMKAAQANKALFFPINPGAEEKSWELLCTTRLSSASRPGPTPGRTSAELIDRFEALLPDTPPWKRRCGC